MEISVYTTAHCTDNISNPYTRVLAACSPPAILTIPHRPTKMPRYREWDLACKVYVGNLGSSASKHEIEGAFAKYGPLRNVWVARNPPGFAFVEFEDRRDAEDATRALDGTRCCGTRIRVEMSSGRSRDRRRGEGGSSGRSGSGRYR